MAIWITVNTSDLYDYLIATQVDILRRQSLASGQNDPLIDIITDITARIRAEISGNKKNVLSSDRTKIPQDLKSYACYLILEAAQTRIPGLKLTADQIRLAQSARDYLRRIAMGEVPIAFPDDVAVVNEYMQVGQGNIDVVSNRIRIATDRSLMGF